eukprot:GFYU01016930.1.p1 GENE.GFYU01016930.1~~GFYU01016930.1.p1  ORF type:complete len:188 (+),score=27.95 GFYU01016930.1:31-564(+)
MGHHTAPREYVQQSRLPQEGLYRMSSPIQIPDIDSSPQTKPLLPLHQQVSSVSAGTRYQPQLSMRGIPPEGQHQQQPQRYLHSAQSAPPIHHAQQIDVAPVDATTFYKQVKQVLEPSQFKLFASNIRMLNAQQQSVDQTLHNIHSIFGGQRPFLYSQLVKLIEQAEQASVAAAATIS